MNKERSYFYILTKLIAGLCFLTILLSYNSQNLRLNSKWIKSDFHLYTTMSDGDITHAKISQKGFMVLFQSDIDRSSSIKTITKWN